MLNGSATSSVSWGLLFEQPMAYRDGVALQERILQARIREEIPDTVLFLQHTPVVTLGRRGRDNFVMIAPESLAAEGIDFETSSRGGDVTYHAPGQAILYPIVSVAELATGAEGYLRLLEQVAIDTAEECGVEAFRRKDMAGAWAAGGKFAAIGFRLKRWISYHGLSLNVDLNLRGFDLIVGCGLEGEQVSSLKKECGLDQGCPSVLEVQQIMATQFVRHTKTGLELFRPSDAPDALLALL